MLGKTTLSMCVMMLLGILAHAETPATTKPATSFAGAWDTTYGPMSLTQLGDAISGTYGPAPQSASIKGKLEGKRYTFTYTESGAKGKGWFELAENGWAFAGQWQQDGAEGWLHWKGTKKAKSATLELNSFTGLWKTSYGKMRLWEEKGEVTGIYEAAGKSTIKGKLEGKVLMFNYDQPDGEKGAGKFELAADGMTFSGTWEGGKDNLNGGGKWAATRILPQAGKTWLVVLEAPWEQNLEQDEYSFGQMLKAFFTRVPSVKIRHRFFHSADDFRKWCDEIPYLAEPVILHISSHGTAEGISSGGKTIDATVIAECIKNMGDLRLLHFGSCLIASGPIPKEIQKQLGSRATFPISGYANVAEWGGSAVIDFTFLDLMFSKRIPPMEAVEQTRKMISFATDKTEPGTTMSPANLLIIPPVQ